MTLSVDAATTNSACSLSGDTVNYVHAGSCVIDANQAGDADTAAAPQVQQTIAVGKVSQTITFPALAGGSLNGSARPAPTATSGLPVTLSVDAATTNGACSLSGDIVTYLHAGSCVIDANQAGNADTAAAPQVQQTIAVGKVSSAVALGLSVAKVTFGHEQVEHLRVTVSPTSSGTTPTGTVTISASGTTLCVTSLGSGEGSCTLSAKKLHAGRYRIVASYGGSADFYGSTSAEKILTVAKATTRTGLRLSVARVTFRHEQVEHFMVSVSPTYSGTTPTGRVTISAYGTRLCVTWLRSGKGSCTLPAKKLHAGGYRIVASYGGSADFSGSSSVKRTLTVV